MRRCFHEQTGTASVNSREFVTKITGSRADNCMVRGVSRPKVYRAVAAGGKTVASVLNTLKSAAAQPNLSLMEKLLKIASRRSTVRSEVSWLIRDARTAGCVPAQIQPEGAVWLFTSENVIGAIVAEVGSVAR
jgi:hypothetical protein